MTDNKSFSHSSFSHKELPVTGILVTNLGTPDEPTPAALKRYLREFLWDPRIVDMPRPLWWVMLQVILLLRPKRSAQSYKKVWKETGSPLLHISGLQAKALSATLQQQFSTPVVVELGMRYGNPSIEQALQNLRKANARRVLVLPLYPQYSCSTTASTFDAVAATVRTWRWLPEFRFINQYHNDDRYIESLATSIRDSRTGREPADKLIFSFHGTPKRFLTTGDPYYCQCQATARLVAERLQLTDEQWQVTFQSIFGREEWLQPYTINTLRELPAAGVKRVDIVCPGFSADCLETLEEIEEENRAAFMEAGGEQYHYIPALNDRPDHISALAALVTRHLQGWLDSDTAYDADGLTQQAEQRRQRAVAKGAAR